MATARPSSATGRGTRTQPRRAATIAVLGTLDTRGDEIGYLRDMITDGGRRAVVVDLGVLGTPSEPGDITREQVAAAAGQTIAALRSAAELGADRALATEAMIRGGRQLVGAMAAAGELDAIIGLGGSTGTALCSSIMLGLPVGQPKLLLTTVASLVHAGDVDLTVMQSPVDLIGLNRIVNRSLAQAASAIIAMSCAQDARPSGRRLVGITALGVTTPAVQHLLSRLDGLGIDGVVFHWRTSRLNQMIADGLIDAVIDLTTYEAVMLASVGDAREAGTDRLPAAAGIPWIIAPGGLDMHIIVTGQGADGIPARLRGRAWSRHGPEVVLVRTDRQDIRRAASFLASQIRQPGLCSVLVPVRGFSDADRPGRPLYSPAADQAFAEQLRADLHGTTAITEVDCHINDPQFADAIISELTSLTNSRTEQ